jgi:hypothetical protein
MRQAFSMVLLLRMLPRSADEEDDDDDDYDGGGGRMTIVLVENDDDDEEDDGTRHRRGQMIRSTGSYLNEGLERVGARPLSAIVPSRASCTSSVYKHVTGLD